MYQFQRKELVKGQSLKYILYVDDEQAMYGDFIRLLHQKKVFRTHFIQLLESIPFWAWQWETPPVTSGTLNQPFEFVVHNSPSIDLPPDPTPFNQYFKRANLANSGSIVVFDNLGGDARLISPVPHEPDINYSHIGVFTKNAPFEQQHALWSKTGEVTEKNIAEHPLWLNTAGGGVAWVHIRLDNRPKYYRYQPYKEVNNYRAYRL